jgi:HEPN domain-containing protein
MNPLTIEWVDKAEGDYVTTQREIRARISPNYDSACFHAQQVAEKYLKAFLQEQGTSIPKIHHLMDLLALCLKIDSSFHMFYSDLLILDGYAVKFRYPGQSATRIEAKAAFKAAKLVRVFVRNKLLLPVT